MNIKPVLWVVTILSIVAIIGIVVLRITAPEDTATIAVLIAFIAPTIATLLLLLKVQETHHSVNSMKDELVKATKDSAEARGKLEGAAEEKAKQDEADFSPQ